MDIHAFLVPKFGHLELLHEFLHPFGLHLRQVGLVDVVHGESLEEGNDIHAFLLLLAHGLILIRTDLMAVLVLDQPLPIDHGEGFFTFQYMGLEVVRLLEGEVHRQAVALGCGLQLEEEGIGTRIVAATHVLRETCKSGCTPNPAFLPVGSLHLLHTGNHHFGKAVDGYLPSALSPSITKRRKPILPA